MAVYLVVDTLIEDAQRYEDYKVLARPVVEKFGGRYLARGGEMDLKESDLWTPTRCVLVEFADMASAKRFYESAEYAEVKPIGRESSKRTLFLLQGI